MEAAGEEGNDYWISSTNWIVAGGSLHDSISFETSTTTPAADDDGGNAIPRGLLLLRPPSEDSPPCEITVCFRDKHDIHRVYMRSTARVYEIYYASDQQNNSKEYLCTVRCGAAATEMTLPSFTEGATTGCQGGNKGTAVLLEQMASCESNNNDEDGWVEVKVPDSPLQDDRMNFLPKRSDGNGSPKMQVHYEATAEISDASPFVSLTLRLLALQTKAYVHVEEIYIYADPVESTNLDPPVNMSENLGGSSLSAMLVPGLLQLLKSGTSRVKNKCSSDESEMPKDQYGREKAAWTVSPGNGNTMTQEGYFIVADKKLRPMQEPSEAIAEMIQSGGSSQKVTEPDQVAKSVTDENNLAYIRVEKVLDELVSRVGRIEAFCSRFEKNMMKPLGCIETRLQRLEQQLDAFTVRTQSSEWFPCLRVSAPEFSFDGSDSENNGCNTSYTAAREDATIHDISSPADEVVASVPESQKCPGLIVKAPEFPYEDDSENNGCNISCTTAREAATFHDISTTADEVVASVPESQMCPGLTVKAPEFPNEDDPDDTLDSLVKEDCPKDSKSISIDGALASALAAFLISTTVKSPKHSPTLMGRPQESLYGNNSGLGSSTVRASSEESGQHFNRSFVEDNACDLLDAVRKGTSPLHGQMNILFKRSLPDEVAAPDNNFNESDMKKGCDTSDLVREGTNLDGLLADEAVTPPVFASQMNASLIVMSTEFPSEDGFLNYDDTLDSQVRGVLKHQPSTPANSTSVSALEAFPSPTMVKSSRSNQILIHVPSELSNVDIKDLETSIVQVPREGVEESGNENNENDNEIDLILNILHPKGSSEQKEHGNNIAVEYSTPDGGATSNSIIHEDSIKQKDHGGVKWNDWHSTETTVEGFLTQGLLHHTGVELNGSINQKCHGGGWTDESDTEAAALSGGPGLNQLGKGWTEDGSSSTSSSFGENFIQNNVQIEWSDGNSSRDSSGWAFTINQRNLHAAASCNYGSTQASAVDSIISHIDITTGTYQSDAGCSKEKKNTELELALSSALDYADVICTVKFAPEKNWISGLPLEVLLGEMADTKVQISTTEGDGEDGIAPGQQHYSSEREGIDRKARTVDQLLSEVEGLTSPTEEACRLGDDLLLLGHAGRSNLQVHNSATEGDNEDCIANRQQHNSSPPKREGADRKAKAVDWLLSEVEDLTSPAEEVSSLGDGVLLQGPSGSSNPKLLSSLI